MSKNLAFFIGTCVAATVIIAKLVGTKLLSNLVLIVVVLWIAGKIFEMLKGHAAI